MFIRFHIKSLNGLFDKLHPIKTIFDITYLSINQLCSLIHQCSVPFQISLRITPHIEDILPKGPMAGRALLAGYPRHQLDDTHWYAFLFLKTFIFLSLSAHPSLTSRHHYIQYLVPVHMIQVTHYDVMTWKYFPLYWPLVVTIHQWPVHVPHKGPVMQNFNVFNVKETVKLLAICDTMRHQFDDSFLLPSFHPHLSLTIHVWFMSDAPLPSSHHPPTLLACRGLWVVTNKAPIGASFMDQWRPSTWMATQSKQPKNQITQVSYNLPLG